MNRKLINYLPSVMSVLAEFKEIMKVEQVQAEKLWTDIDSLLREKYIDSNSRVGASRWEGVLGITPLQDESLEIRNLRIKAKLMEDLPYTEETLRKMLTVLCGKNSYSMVLKNSEYTLIVRLSLEKKQLFDSVQDLCERVVPLNIILDVSLLYNTHKILSAFNHQTLEQYTHKECREEDIKELLDIGIQDFGALFTVDTDDENLYAVFSDGKEVSGIQYNADSGKIYYVIGGEHE